MIPSRYEDLKARGYVWRRSGVCQGPHCGAALEWFATPSGKMIALEKSGSVILAHAETCPDREAFRKKKAKRTKRAKEEERKRELREEAARLPQRALF